MKLSATSKPMLIGRTAGGSYELAHADNDSWSSWCGFSDCIRTLCPTDMHALTNIHMRKGESPKLVTVTFKEVSQ